MTHFTPGIVTAPPIVPINLTHEAVPDETAGSPYQFTSVGYGTPKANRATVIVVSYETAGAGDTCSVDVDSVAATEIVNNNTLAENVSIFVIANPTGTSGTIDITVTGTPLGCTIHVFSMYGANLTAHHTATDSTGNPISMALNIPEGGAAIAAIHHRSNTDPTTYAWTGLTERYEIRAAAVSPHFASGAADGEMSIETGRVIESTASNAGVRNQFAVAASFAPA